MNWKVLLATLVIFGSGVATGALLLKTAACADSKAPVPEKKNAHALPLQRMDFLRRMETNLDLSVQQKERLEKIMRQSQERTKPLWEQIAPQMAAEMQRLREEMRRELAPGQQARFEQLLAQHPPRKGQDSNAPSSPPKPAPAPAPPAAAGND